MKIKRMLCNAITIVLTIVITTTSMSALYTQKTLAATTETATEFVNRCYTYIFGRDRLSGEGSTYITGLVDGTSGASIAVNNFYTSTEFINRCATNKEYITSLYQVFLNRMPSESEMTTHIQAASNGMSRQQMFTDIVKSAEAETICSLTGIAYEALDVTGTKSVQTQTKTRLVTRDVAMYDFGYDYGNAKSYYDSVFNVENYERSSMSYSGGYLWRCTSGRLSSNPTGFRYSPIGISMDVSYAGDVYHCDFAYDGAYITINPITVGDREYTFNKISYITVLNRLKQAYPGNINKLETAFKTKSGNITISANTYMTTINNTVVNGYVTENSTGTVDKHGSVYDTETGILSTASWGNNTQDDFAKKGNYFNIQFSILAEKKPIPVIYYSDNHIDTNARQLISGDKFPNSGWYNAEDVTENALPLWFSATCNDDNSVSISIKNNSNSQVVASNNSGTWLNQPYTGDTNGTTFTITATSSSGISVAETFVIKADTIAPNITYNVPAQEKDGWYSQSGLEATFTSSDDSPSSGVYNTTINGSVVSSPARKALNEGANTYVVASVDNAGNKSTRTITLKLDTTAPEILCSYDYEVEGVNYTYKEKMNDDETLPKTQNINGDNVEVWWVKEKQVTFDAVEDGEAQMDLYDELLISVPKSNSAAIERVSGKQLKHTFTENDIDKTFTIIVTDKVGNATIKRMVIKFPKFYCLDSNGNEVNINDEYGFDYTGMEIKPTALVRYGIASGGGMAYLQQNSDYTVEYEENINAGTAIVKIKGAGEYMGTAIGEFEINPIVAQISWKVSNSQYDNEYHNPYIYSGFTHGVYPFIKNIKYKDIGNVTVYTDGENSVNEAKGVGAYTAKVSRFSSENYIIEKNNSNETIDWEIANKIESNIGNSSRFYRYLIGG